MSATQASGSQVVVIGAGPVGLFAALSLAEFGCRVQVLEAEVGRAAREFSMPLSARSADLLRRAGLGSVLDRARPLRKLCVHDADRPCGQLALVSHAADRSVPVVIGHAALEAALLDALSARDVPVRWGHCATRIAQDSAGVVVRGVERRRVSLSYPEPREALIDASTFELSTAFVLGADGYRSLVRREIGARYDRLADAVICATFETPQVLTDSDGMLVVFTGGATASVWPTQGGTRFTFELTQGFDRPADDEHLASLVAERMPFLGRGDLRVAFGAVSEFPRLVASRFGSVRAWLAGEAAHVSEPFGGHSINGGLEQAYGLARRMSAVICDGESLDVIEELGAARAESWRKVHSRTAKLTLDPDAPPWLNGRASALSACIPACGGDLLDVLSRVGVRVE